MEKSKRVFPRIEDPPIFNEAAFKEMQEAEVKYLIANGWFQEDVELDEWSHDKFLRDELTQGHAVNVQKHYDRIWASAKRAESGRTSSAHPNLSNRPREDPDDGTDGDRKA